MRALRVICNILLALTVCFVSTLVQIGVYDILAAQSGDVTAIHISANGNDEIAYFDSFSFWATDISTNLRQGAKYRIRNIFSWNWWKSGMAWADTGLDIIIGVVKPIVVPVAEINAVKIHYGKNINDFNRELSLRYDSDEATNNALYELYVIFNHGYGTANTIEGEPIESWHYTGSYDTSFNYTDNDYARWLSHKGNKSLYNINWKLTKYNSGSYTKYFEKFITEFESGDRSTKTAAVVLYYHQILSVLLGVYIVYRYPVALAQGRFIGRRDKRKRHDDDISL